MANLLNKNNKHLFLEKPDKSPNSFVANMNSLAKSFRGLTSEEVLALKDIPATIVSTGEEWKLILEETALDLLAGASAFNTAIVTRITEDVPANSEIVLPDIAKYVVGTNMLMLSYNGTVCYLGEQFEEIGEPHTDSNKIKILFDLRTDDVLEFRIVALNTDINKSAVIAEGSTEPRVLSERFSDIVNVKDFGARGDGITDDTAAIQAAIDFVAAEGGGRVFFPEGDYRLSASAKTDIYNNYGESVLASTAALIVTDNISLQGDHAKLLLDDPAITAIYLVGARNITITNFVIENVWEVDKDGAGHGIFQLAKSTDYYVENCTLSNLTFKGIGSYCIGIQNGCPRNCLVENIRASIVGADVVDLKSRGSSEIPYGNICRNVYAERYGERVTGSAAVDVRGIWDVSEVTAVNFGHDSSKEFFGVRFRSLPPSTDVYTKAAQYSTAHGIFVEGQKANCSGVFVGSPECHVYDAIIKSCRFGVVTSGNENGNPSNIKVSNCLVIEATTAYQSGTGNINDVFMGCTSVQSDVGYRIQGTSTFVTSCISINDNTDISVASIALPTFINSAFYSTTKKNFSERFDANNIFFEVPGDSSLSLRYRLTDASIIYKCAVFMPGVDNTTNLGSGSARWANIFASTAVINTSDEREKTDISNPDEALMRAWGKVGFKNFRFKDSVARKGDDARVHIGVIAQQVAEAFASEGLDVSRYSIWCHDEWDAWEEQVVIIDEPAIEDEEGNVIVPEKAHTETIHHPAGDRYGIRYSEALALECAYQRWLGEKREQRITALEAKLGETNV